MPTPVTLRVRSGTPTSYSMSRICRLRDGCDVWSFFSAASERLPASTTATKYRRWRNSIGCLHALKASQSAYKVLFTRNCEVYSEPYARRSDKRQITVIQQVIRI